LDSRNHSLPKQPYPYPCDIRNATVTCVNRDTITVIAANVPVGLVSSSDTKTGTATYNWNMTISCSLSRRRSRLARALQHAGGDQPLRRRPACDRSPLKQAEENSIA